MRVTTIVFAAMCYTTIAAAQSATRIIVPFGSGGATDLIARLMKDPLEETLKRPVYVENKAGAEGTIGASEIAQATPDGSTIGLVPSAVAVAQAQEKDPDNAPYAVKKFVPICSIATFGTPIVVRADSPFTSVRDLIEYAKKRRGEVTVGYTNASTRTIASTVEDVASIKLSHIPYNSKNGEAQLAMDLIGRRLDVGIFTLGAMLGHVQAGGLRILAVTTPQRSALVPDIPTMEEAGIRNWPDFTFFVTMVAPPGFPEQRSAVLEQACSAVLDNPRIGQKLGQFGYELFDKAHRSRTATKVLIDGTYEKWRARFSKLPQ